MGGGACARMSGMRSREARMTQTDNVSRRRLLQAGIGAAVAAGVGLPQPTHAQIAGVGVADGPLPGRSTAHTLEGIASTAKPGQTLGVDIHAHYYPEAYLEVMAEGRAYGGDYQPGPNGYSLKSPGFSGGPFPAKFTDMKLRLADMDAQGVKVHALSLT